MKQRVEQLCTISVFIQLETYSVRIIIIEVLLYTHCNFKSTSFPGFSPTRERG